MRRTSSADTALGYDPAKHEEVTIDAVDVEEKLTRESGNVADVAKRWKLVGMSCTTAHAKLTPYDMNK